MFYTPITMSTGVRMIGTVFILVDNITCFLEKPHGHTGRNLRKKGRHWGLTQGYLLT